jgi:large subunit ribosomal protein L16
MPMGSGKGEVDVYTARVPRGKVIFEISWLNDAEARTVLIKASKKLSVKARVLKKWEIR